MKYLILFWLVIFSFPLFSSTYVGGEVGKSQYISSVTEKYNLKSIGNDYTLSFGKSVQYIGFEAYLKLHDTTSKITHNSVDYRRIEKATTYGANIRFNLEYTYFKLGYALHSLKGQINTTSGVSVNDTTMNAIYQTGDSYNKTTGGIAYGLGFQYRFTKSLRMTLGYDYYETGRSSEHFHQISTGIIIKLPDFDVNFEE